MKLSGLKSADQGRLFDESLLNNDGQLSLGYARHVAGELIEQLTALTFGGSRHKTDSRCDYCPDISVATSRGPVFYEAKAVGLAHQAFIYAGRFQKDIRFARRYTLNYVIWHHHAPTKLATTVNELRCLLLQRMQCCYVIPFSNLRPIVSGEKIERLNSKYGHSDTQKKMYGAGYRINLSLLEEFKLFDWEYEG